VKVTLTKLSICPCGFPLLKESVGLGQEYDIEPSQTVLAKMICGGCGAEIPVKTVYVHSRTGVAGGYLPEEVFSPIAGSTPHPSPLPDRGGEGERPTREPADKKARAKDDHFPKGRW